MFLKFDLFGNFIQNFGGFDWGIYSLNNPKRLTVNFDNSVLVLDDTLLIVYDQFGNGKEKISLNKTFTGLRTYAAGLILSDEKEIYIGTFGVSENILTKLNLIGIPEDFKIISCYIFNGKLYVLSPHEIFVFKKANE